MSEWHGLEFRITRCPMWMRDGFEMRILDRETRSYALPLTMQQTHEAMEIPPCLTLDTEHAQQLCDSLWEAGVRPTGGAGSVGQLSATERHLEDMRSLVFDPSRYAASKERSTK